MVRQGWTGWIALFALALALAATLIATRLTQPLDALIHDAIVRATPRTPDPRILIVGIDDGSIASVGRWPWPRRVHADIIDRLSAGTPAVIAYDVLFVDPSPDDALLQAAVTRARSVVLPLILSTPGDNGATFRVTPPVVRTGNADGHVVARTDPDGSFRRIVTIERSGAASWPHLSLAALGFVMPRARATGALIPFAGPPGSYPSVSAGAVLRGEVPPELLHDRIILVGATAAGLGDRFATPVGGERDLMPGVEIQANILDALMHDGLRREAGPLAAFVLAAVALLILWAAFLRLSPRANLLAAAGLIVGVTLFSATMLVAENLWIAPAAALVTVATMFPVWGWRRLAAASEFLTGELARLGDVTAPGVRGDLLARQIALVESGLARIAQLRGEREETLAFLSHDLRSPAAAIVTLIGGSEDGRDRRIAAQATRVLRLADQFVHVARAGQAPLVRDHIAIGELLDEVADGCWESAKALGSRIIVAVPGNAPDIHADRALLARALTNLIDNALKYGARGTVVQLRAWATDERLSVTVADSGPGMAGGQSKALFAAFDRAGRTRADGVGLGLTLVATVARRHGGRVACVSGVGIGSVFSVDLPLDAPSARAR